MPEFCKDLFASSLCPLLSDSVVRSPGDMEPGLWITRLCGNGHEGSQAELFFVHYLIKTLSPKGKVSVFNVVYA